VLSIVTVSERQDRAGWVRAALVPLMLDLLTGALVFGALVAVVAVVLFAWSRC